MTKPYIPLLDYDEDLDTLDSRRTRVSQGLGSRRKLVVVGPVVTTVERAVVVIITVRLDLVGFDVFVDLDLRVVDLVVQSFSEVFD